MSTTSSTSQVSSSARPVTLTACRVAASVALVAAAMLIALLTCSAPAAASTPIATTASARYAQQAPTSVVSMSVTSSTANLGGTAPTLAGPGLKAGCFGPDIRCEVQVGADIVIDAVTPDISLPDPGELIDNPLAQAGEAITQVVRDAWTAAMLAVWDAGLFVLAVVLNFIDSFLTPDLSGDGPGREVYAYTLWIAATLVLIMAMLQLGVAAFRRDGKSLATMLIGTAQFAVVWSAWIGYCVLFVNACGVLTRALMKALLGVESWPEWDPWKDLSAADVTNATVATVLGMLGMVLWIAAIGHLLVLLTRAAALLILAATGAIAAAGLVSDAGRSWFWKSLRWFHAAALTPVIMVLILGIGVRLATGVASGLTDTTQQAVGTALPAVVLICISCVAPLALFKLLAFVDPSTPSGASVRAGLAGAGGVQGLLSGSGGGGAGGSAGSGAAAQSDSHGRSAGESSAEEDTSARFSKKTAGAMSALGPVGAALGAGAGMVASIGAKGASVGADVSNQMGVGHTGYQPDFSGIRNNRDSQGDNQGGQPQRQAGEETPGSGQDGAGAPSHGQGETGNAGHRGYPGGPDPSTSAPNPATVGGGSGPGGQDGHGKDVPAGAPKGAPAGGRAGGAGGAGAGAGGAGAGAGGAASAGGVPV